MESMVSTAWLEKHLDDPDLVVLDCTNLAEPGPNGRDYKTVSARELWEKEHIYRSGYAEFTSDLSGDATQFRNMLPTPEQFAAAMGALGVGDDKRVVLYDAKLSMWAARTWWMLRWVGFDNAAVLDGGWQSWTAEGRPTSTAPSPHETAILTPRPRPELFVTREAVMAALDDGSIRLIDALSEAQFTGEKSQLGLCGHIPGAVNIPAEDLVDPETFRFLPEKQLAGCFPDSRDQRTIIYCGSGIAAASNAHAMTRLGFNDISIYMPGLQEWVYIDGAPLVNGPAPIETESEF